MSYMEWNDELSVKVKEIDEQHKKLVQMINRLYIAMQEGEGSAMVGHILDEMTEYTAYHFQTEEKYMTQVGFAGFEDHKKKHEDFVKQVSDFKSGFTSGKLLLSIEVLKFLSDWVVNHILGTDKKYSGALNAGGIK